MPEPVQQLSLMPGYCQGNWSPEVASQAGDIVLSGDMGRGEWGGTGQHSAPSEKPNPGLCEVGESRGYPLARSLADGGGRAVQSKETVLVQWESLPGGAGDTLGQPHDT